MAFAPGQTTIISAQDEAKVRKHNWFNNRGYAYGLVNGKRVNLGRFILGLSPDSKLQPDHINNNKLDNRRENLRAVSHRENSKNMFLTNAAKHGLIVASKKDRAMVALSLAKVEKRFLEKLAKRSRTRASGLARKIIVDHMKTKGFKYDYECNGKNPQYWINLTTTPESRAA
jgi:hypothetical protein